MILAAITLNNSIYSKYQEKLVALGSVHVRMSTLINILSTLFLCIIVVVSANLVLHNSLKLGELVALLSMASTLVPLIVNLSLLPIPLSEANVAFSRMYELISTQSIENSSNCIELSSLDSIEGKNITFRYIGRPLLIDKFSFFAKKGEIISLVGENGSGKSTIAKIIRGDYSFEEGIITLNQNIPFHHVLSESWNNHCVIVPQHVHLFNATVLENIAYDDVVSKHDSVMAFLQEYSFMTFLNKLPNSINTLVGDEGVSLSGGQRQMIGIARALYQKPSLLILDEATSHMDRDSERFVLSILNKIRPKTIIIIITHKLSILRKHCDRIYALENGQLGAVGSHDELIEYDNAYSRYWAGIQA